MIWIILLFALLCNAVAISAEGSTIPAGGATLMTSSPTSINSQSSAISASLSSLLGHLNPPASITSGLSAIPSDILTGLQGTNFVSAWYEMVSENSSASWWKSLPPGATRWINGLPTQAVAIWPQVASLEALASSFATQTSSISAPSDSTSPISNSTSRNSTATALPTIASKSSHGLSPAEMVGIIIATAAVLAVALVAGFVFYNWRKKRAIAQTTSERNSTWNTKATFGQSLGSEHEEKADNPGPVGLSSREEPSGHDMNKEAKQDVYEFHGPAELPGREDPSQHGMNKAGEQEIYEMHCP